MLFVVVLACSADVLLRKVTMYNFLYVAAVYRAAMLNRYLEGMGGGDKGFSPPPLPLISSVSSPPT